MMNKFRRWRELAFPPLVFSATGGMSPVATTVYGKLASMLPAWKMEDELQLLFVLGQVLLVLFFVEVWCDVFEGS